MPTNAKKTKTNPKVPKKTTAKKPAKAQAEPTAKKKLSALDAAAQVLADNGGSMNTKEMIEAMAAKKLWESPNGKTPSATLYAAILRELTTKGADSRFQKTEPGKFAATAAASKTEEVQAPAPKEKKPQAAKKAKKVKKAQPTAAGAPDAGTAPAA